MRPLAGLAALGLIAAVVAPGSTATGATAPRPRAAPSRCPRPESLVGRAHWHHDVLAPGIKLAEGNAHDSRGTVSMHVVRAQLGRRSVTVRPLVHKLARRQPLSALAAGHSHLFAAINTGYFDFITGAPTGPVIVGKRPLVLSAAHQKVVGLNTHKRMQSGRVWLSAYVLTPHGRVAVDAVNELRPHDGISVYTGRWGGRSIRLHNAVSRYISRRGRLGAIARHRKVRSHHVLLVARGPRAQRQLRSIGTHGQVSFHARVRTNAKRPFRQAYGVGAELVKRAGRPRHGFRCDSSNTKTPARTAIGYADHGRKLVLVVVADHPHTRMHGLDNSQLSTVMTELKVSRAFDFDGSGSSELVARLQRHHPLSIRNYTADGVERPMPIGLGVFSRR